MKKNHPYRDYEKLKAWKVLANGVKRLEANGDLEEKTARPYIVGYLTKLLAEANLLTESAPEPVTGAPTLVEWDKRSGPARAKTSRG